MISLDEFIDYWNLERQGDDLVDPEGNYICRICGACGKVVASSATCNSGTWQPDYCQCDD